MKKNTGILLSIIAIHISFIILQIYKHTQYITHTYRIQKSEQKKNTLMKKKQALMQQLYTLKDRDRIKKFACTMLGMQSVRIHQVKKLIQNDKQI